MSPPVGPTGLPEDCDGTGTPTWQVTGAFDTMSTLIVFDGTRVPLHETAANNDRAMAELLISKGALPDIKDDKGKTSADFARERGHPEMAAWLDSLKR